MITMDTDIDDKKLFVKKLNECLKELLTKGDIQDSQDLIPIIDIDDVINASPNVFVLEGYVPYFDSYEDLPRHIRDLVLDFLNNGSRFAKFGIKNLAFQTSNKNILAED
jgi:hypothetical protein